MRIGVDAEDRSEEQRRDQHDVPDQFAGQQRLVARAGRAAHGAGFGRLEGQREPQRDGGDQVDPEDLHRGDRQRHAGEERHDDGHRLARIGGQRPADDLLDVVVDGAPLAHGRGDGGEVVVGQHELGGLLRRFAALQAHGDPGIGALQRGRVVHPVAGHRDGQAARLQRGDEAQLVGRRGAGEDVGLHRRLGQRGVVHRLDIGAGQNAFVVLQPDHARRWRGRWRRGRR